MTAMNEEGRNESGGTTWRFAANVALTVALLAGCGGVDGSESVAENGTDGAETAEESEPVLEVGDVDDAAADRGAWQTDERRESTFGTVDDSNDLVGPEVAVGPEGAPRVAWARRYGSGPIHLARLESDGWETSTSKRFRYDEVLENIVALDLVATGDETVVRVGTSEYHGDGVEGAALFSVSDGSWERHDVFGKGFSTFESTRIDATGRLHFFALDHDVEEGESAVHYFHGRPAEPARTKLYRSHSAGLYNFAVVDDGDGGFRAVYENPKDDHHYHVVDPGQEDPRRLEGLRAIESLDDIRAMAADGEGRLHFLGRTGQRGRALYRRVEPGVWSELEVAGELETRWRRACRDGRSGYDQLHGETCRVDHVSYTMPRERKTLLRRGDRLWVAKIRRHTTGTATWECEEDYHGCLQPCRLNEDVETDETVVLGRVGKDGVEFREADVPPEAFSQRSEVTFGPEGDLHWVRVDLGETEEADERLRYGNIRFE